MTGGTVSIDAVEVQGRQYLAAATIGDTSVVVAGPVDEAPSSTDATYILGKLFETASERAEPVEPAQERVVTDGGIDRELLEKRKNQRSTTDRDEQKRCPECGSVSVYPKRPSNGGEEREHEEPYWCRVCGRHVEPEGPTALTDGGSRCDSTAYTLTGDGSIPPGHEPTAAEMEGDRE